MAAKSGAIRAEAGEARRLVSPMERRWSLGGRQSGCQVAGVVLWWPYCAWLRPATAVDPVALDGGNSSGSGVRPGSAPGAGRYLEEAEHYLGSNGSLPAPMHWARG